MAFPSLSCAGFQISEEDLSKLPLGSKWRVDDRCVRVARVPPRIDVDELSFFFRDFRLAPDGIQRIISYVILVIRISCNIYTCIH